MNITEARAFVLAHPDAVHKDNALHNRYLLALEVIEKYRRERAAELEGIPKVLTNPRWNRMTR